MINQVAKPNAAALSSDNLNTRNKLEKEDKEEKAAFINEFNMQNPKSITKYHKNNNNNNKNKNNDLDEERESLNNTTDDEDSDDEEEEDDDDDDDDDDNDDDDDEDNSKRELVLERNGTGSDYSTSLLNENRNHARKNQIRSSLSIKPSFRNSFKTTSKMQSQSKSETNHINNQQILENANSNKTTSPNRPNPGKPPMEGGESSIGPGDLPNLERSTRGERSPTFNNQMTGAENDGTTISNSSDKKKKIVVKIVTIITTIFFIMCFAMIAFTLRMSEKIDAEIREKYNSGDSSQLASISFGGMGVGHQQPYSLSNHSSTKKIHPMLISQPSDELSNPNANANANNNKVISKLRADPANSTTSYSILFRVKSSSSTPSTSTSANQRPKN